MVLSNLPNLVPVHTPRVNGEQKFSVRLLGCPKHNDFPREKKVKKKEGLKRGKKETETEGETVAESKRKRERLRKGQ